VTRRVGALQRLKLGTSKPCRGNVHTQVETVLQFVNWRAVNALFCGLMWLIALTLVLAIIVSRLPSTPPSHRAAAAAVVR
jgi:hypothetical protein